MSNRIHTFKHGVDDIEAAALREFNRRHDHPVTRKLSGHVLGPPGFDKNKPGQDHDAVVWAWHNRETL